MTEQFRAGVSFLRTRSKGWEQAGLSREIIGGVESMKGCHKNISERHGDQGKSLAHHKSWQLDTSRKTKQTQGYFHKYFILSKNLDLFSKLSPL